MDTWSNYVELTRTAFSDYQDNDPFNDFLGLVDVDFLTACEYTNFHRTLSRPGQRLPPAQGHFLGEGGTYSVRRIPYRAADHRVAALGEPELEPKPNFVVLKQQIVYFNSGLRDTEVRRLRAAILEMKILRHQPIRDHPNIISLFQTRWDFQDDFSLTLPSVIMEYGEFGTLADFQDPEMLAEPLAVDVKMSICLDVARGLEFLHGCGVIHGDMKPEYVPKLATGLIAYQCPSNVLLCQNPRDKDKCIAKISDFGSSLIQVSDGMKKRRITKGTPGWRAPGQRSGDLLDVSALRKVDAYSYGLLVWFVLLNGTRPWKTLSKSKQKVIYRHACSQETDKPMATLSADDFDTFKQADRGDEVHQLAKQSIEGDQTLITGIIIFKEIFQRTIGWKSSDRATNFHEVIKALESPNAEFKTSDPPVSITPKLLEHGDFYLDSSWLPWSFFRLSTCPLPFRRVTCMEMHRVMGQLDDSDPRKTQLQLALAISHYQGFAPNPNTQYACELVYQAAKAGNIQAQHMCQPCFIHSGIPCPTQVDLWVKEGVRRGSFLARKSLGNTNHTVLKAIHDQIKTDRERLGDRWIRSIKMRGTAYLNLDEAIARAPDEAFRLFAEREGVTPLHMAALTGNARLVKQIIEQDAEINVTNVDGESPLHYAALSGSLDAISTLVSKMASVNSQSNLMATPLHYAVLGSASIQVLEFLCKSGADLNIASNNMDSFQKQGAFSDFYFNVSGTPLAWATIIENTDAVQTLLSRGADPFRGEMSSYNFPSWHAAFNNRSIDIIAMMFSDEQLEMFNRSPPEFNEIVPFLGSQLTTPLRLILHGAQNRKNFVQSILNLDIWKSHSIDKNLVIIESLDLQLFQEDVVGLIEDIIAEKGFKPGVNYGICQYKPFMNDYYMRYRVSLDSFLALAIGTSPIEVVRMLFRYIGTLKTTLTSPIVEYENAPAMNQDKITFFERLCFSRSRNEHEIADMVECLLAHGADRNVQNITNWPGGSVSTSDSLTVAADTFQIEVVKVFLDYGVGDAWAALVKAVSDANSLLALRVMSTILERRPEILLAKTPSRLDDFSAGSLGLIGAEGGSCLLHTCLTILCDQGEFDRSDTIAERKWKKMEEAIQIIPDGRQTLIKTTRARDFLGSTLLHHAAKNGNMRLCEFLLDSGAEINATISFLPFDLNNVLPSLPPLDLPPLPEPSPSAAEHTPESRMPLAFDPPKGHTPLDYALGRDWVESRQRAAFVAKGMMETYRLGGNHKQRRDYKERTDCVVAFLRKRGGKLSSEL